MTYLWCHVVNGNVLFTLTKCAQNTHWNMFYYSQLTKMSYGGLSPRIQKILAKHPIDRTSGDIRVLKVTDLPYWFHPDSKFRAVCMKSGNFASSLSSLFNKYLDHLFSTFESIKIRPILPHSVIINFSWINTDTNIHTLKLIDINVYKIASLMYIT